MGLLFRQARDNMRGRWEQEIARSGHDLTVSQCITIKKLVDGVASVTDLARAAEVNPGAMTRLLDKLEARSLIARETDPNDRRALHIHLTDAGRAIWRDIDRCSQRVLDSAFTGIDDVQRREFVRLLEKVRDNLSLSTEHPKP